MQFGVNKHEYIFSKTKKLMKPIGWARFEVLEKKNKKLIYTKLHLKSCYYLLIVYMKKSISESRETKFWQRARYLQFAPVLQIDTRVTWKMHLFKPIPARNFFSRILLQCISNFDLNWRETLICWPSFRAFDFN